MQTFGDFLGYNPHTHILVTDGCFLRQAQDDVYGNKGMFRVAPPLELKKLEAIFLHKVLRMLLSKGKITATSHGESGRRKAAMLPSPVFSNHTGMKRHAGGTGRGLFKKSTR